MGNMFASLFQVISSESLKFQEKLYYLRFVQEIILLEICAGSLRQEGDEDPDGRARRRRKDDDSLQAQAWGDCHHYPHHR